MDPISRTPYGPAATEGCIKRPDIRQYLTRLPPTRFRSHACPPGGVHIRDSDLCRSAEEAQAAGRLNQRLKTLTNPALLVVDEIGYLPVTRSGAILSSSSSTAATSLPRPWSPRTRRTPGAGDPGHDGCRRNDVELQVDTEVVSRWHHWYAEWGPSRFTQLDTIVSSMTTIRRTCLLEYAKSSDLSVALVARVHVGTREHRHQDHSVDVHEFWINPQESEVLAMPDFP